MARRTAMDLGVADIGPIGLATIEAPKRAAELEGLGMTNRATLETQGQRIAALARSRAEAEQAKAAKAQKRLGILAQLIGFSGQVGSAYASKAGNK